MTTELNARLTAEADRIILELFLKKFQTHFYNLFFAIAGSMALLMMVGRGLFEIGSLSQRSTRHIAAKNLTQFAVCCLIYFSIGHGLSKRAFGGFYGTRSYFMLDVAEQEFSRFFLDLVSCWFCVSVASATLCERTFSGTHAFIALFISGILYPIASSWVWGGGWLNEMGFIDQSGASVIHVLGGMVGLIGTIILKPRLN